MFSHGVTAVKQWNGGHIGVASWTLFLCKTLFCFNTFVRLLASWMKTFTSPASTSLVVRKWKYLLGSFKSFFLVTKQRFSLSVQRGINTLFSPKFSSRLDWSNIFSLRIAKLFKLINESKRSSKNSSLIQCLSLSIWERTKYLQSC